MPSFNYTAVNSAGRKQRGVILADNEVDLESRLKQVGLDLLESKIAKEKKAGFFGRIKNKDLIILCLHLEQLDRAGVPLLDSLGDIRDTTESLKLKDVMTGVYEAVKNGSMLSAAFSLYPKIFNEVFVGLIAAGEKTGNLSESFHHIGEHLKWSGDIRRKVRKAIAYPIFLLLLMSLVITVLMLFVVPKLIKFIVAQGFDIPFHTRALIFVSDAFAGYWYLILGVPLALFMVGFALYRTSEPFAYRVDAIMLKVPVIGPTMRKINLARFTHFFSVMFRSGIDMLESLETARGVVGNRVIADAIDTARRSVTEGNSLTASLRLSDQFPNLVIRMFKVGEDSGNMNSALDNINFFYSREVNDSVDGMVSVIQPALTIVMGLLILWVVSAVFGPLYQSFSKIKF